MKSFVRTLVVVVVLMAMTFTLVACGDRNPPGTSSSVVETIPPSSALPDLSEPGTSLPNEESGMSSSEEASVLTTSADFATIGALDGARLDWGPGGPVDDKNRSEGSLAYNKKYGKYNATFLEEDSDAIYLTFDQGYENGYTPAFLDALKEKGVKGIFFLTGDYVRRQPELVQRMKDEGHVLGSHSDKHPEDITSMPLSEVYADTQSLHDMVVEQFDYECKLYRFPSGVFNEQTLALMQDVGYKSVFWSFAYKDWLVDAQPDPDEALTKMLNAAHPGGIYLLHTVSKTNSEIIGQLIDGLQDKGFEIGDPNDLIG